MSRTETMRVWLVDFRIVKKSHDHRGVCIAVWHSDDVFTQPGTVKTPEEAEKVARRYLDNVAVPAPAELEDEKALYLGNVKVENVQLVEIQAAEVSA